jgi:hypothetical protein
MKHTIFIERPEELSRDLAEGRLEVVRPNVLLRFGPRYLLEISYETQAESKSGAIHEAANIVRALMGETDSISVSAIALDATSQLAEHPEGIPFQLRTATETYACVFRAFTEDPDA